MTRPLTSTRLSAVAVVAITVLLLTACAAETPRRPTRTPTVTPSPSSTPTPTPDGELARIVIDADGVDALDGAGHSLRSVQFGTDAQTAADQISEALDEEPTKATVTTDECYPELDEASWGGLHLYSSPDGLTRPRDAAFFVTADAAATSGGIPITTPSGRGVGATRAQALAADPSAPSFSNDGEIDLHYDIASGSASGDPSSYFGALAVISGGRVTRLDSPIFYSRPC